MRINAATLIILFGASLLSGCQKNEENPKVKNVILMIGDGMGPGQISLLHHFLKSSGLKEFAQVENAFERLSVGKSVAISNTEPSGNIVVDSACSATQLALGESSRSEMIGLDVKGNPVDSILKKAKKKGLATGLVSDTRMTHATPAAFAANVANRWYEDDIAKGMIETAPDVLFSGGANRFLPKGESRNLGAYEVMSRRGDELDLLAAAKGQGFQLATERAQLSKLDPSKKVLGLFTAHNYPDAIWFHENENNPQRKIPNLLEMSKAAVEHLSNSEKGFFLMIEGGQIDWAAHQNDAGTMLHEMLSFNKTLNWVIDWVKKNPDTLLVVTADHETGGFGIGYNINELPQPEKLSGSAFKEIDFRPQFDYGKSKSLRYLYGQKKSLYRIWKEYESMPDTEKGANLLARLMEANTGMKVELSQASRALENEPNRFHASWHRALHTKTLPKVDFNREFYYDPVNTRMALMGQALSARQNVVWGTGGHTATGVHVYSMGPEQAAKKFSGTLSHPQVGKLLQDSLGL